VDGEYIRLPARVEPATMAVIEDAVDPWTEAPGRCTMRLAVPHDFGQTFPTRETCRSRAAMEAAYATSATSTLAMSKRTTMRPATPQPSSCPQHLLADRSLRGAEW
jgi:hypothetical protein